MFPNADNTAVCPNGHENQWADEHADPANRVAVVDLTDKSDPKVLRALARSCDICGARRDQYCNNLQGLPLANGHLIHQYRLDKPKAGVIR
jgi:hypothetical protein